MWRSKELILIAVMIITALIIGVVAGEGCTPAGSNYSKQPQIENPDIKQAEPRMQERTTNGRQLGMPLAKEDY